MPETDSAQVVAVANLLRPILDELVFVGGAITALLISDEGAGPPRTTLDVDAIAEITSYAEYAAFGERLRALGFSEDYERRCAAMPVGSESHSPGCDAAG
ncbi:MAG TPA: hypothetical protein VHC90_11685 [Bryobacteraceae bacterium]|nr:hypothetical protein [Bryobacteraceae bacterium]